MTYSFDGDWEREGERGFDQETLRRWRSEAITSSSPDRIWLNRCEALCVALLEARARLDRVEHEAPDYIKRLVRPDGGAA